VQLKVTLGLSRHSSLSDTELIRACAESNDAAAWGEFVSRFQPPISLSIQRTVCQSGKDPRQFVDDLLQETFLKLCADRCRSLLEFAVLHPDAVRPYIRTIAINVTHDHFKSLQTQKHGSGKTDQLVEDFDHPSLDTGPGGPGAMEQEVLLGQIDFQLQHCAAGPNQQRDCQIFWFYFLHGMSARAIAGLATIQLTTKGVEAVIFRLARCLRQKLGGPGLPDSADP
jgi:RNA polymerase sigma-70 factor (ECF subfamily)